ncbi:MAG: 5,10-methylenetetrahydrofolate reductase, partial [Deltaproteobacteria bacterium]
EFCIGTPIHLTTKDHDLEVRDMEEKMGLGVDFFLTSSIYDAGLFETFIKKTAHLKVPVIAGVTLLKSAGMARYINKNVGGASIPETVIGKLMKASNKHEASVDIAKEMIRQLRPLCQGIQIIPIGWEPLIPVVLDQSGL